MTAAQDKSAWPFPKSGEPSEHKPAAPAPQDATGKSPEKELADEQKDHDAKATRAVDSARNERKPR